MSRWLSIAAGSLALVMVLACTPIGDTDPFEFTQPPGLSPDNPIARHRAYLEAQPTLWDLTVRTVVPFHVTYRHFREN